MYTNIIGIDPSISSTGICITNESGSNRYVLIPARPTKKLMDTNIPGLDTFPYDYKPQTGLTGIEKEIVKSHNVSCIGSIVDHMLCIYKPAYVVIEAVAFQANGTIDQLAGLNYLIRHLAWARNIPIYPVSPSAIKKAMVGDGGATKETMIRAWTSLDPLGKEISERIKKCDDLADAFHMAHFPGIGAS